MLWAVADSGFLPATQPHITIPINDYKNTQLIFALENLGCNLPHLLSERRWREEIVCELRQSAPCYAHNIIDNLGAPPEIERAFLLLTLFANSYVFALHEKPLLRVPKEISIPIARAAFLCGRQPLINYTSYVLYNWCDGKVVNTLTDTDTERTLIEAFAKTEVDFGEFLKKYDASALVEFFEKTLHRFRGLRAVMKVDEFDLLGDLYGDFTNVLYEGWQQVPISYECNVFAQATFLSAIYKMLGITDKDPLLHRCENDICIYRPAAHNKYISGLKSLPVGRKCLDLFKELHHEMFMIRGADAWRVPRLKALEICKTRLGVTV